MRVTSDWIKNIQSELKVLPEEDQARFPAKKCPRCGKMTMKFDPEKKRMYCSNCSLDVPLEVWK